MDSNSRDEYEYDIALSFASEDRGVVDEVANILKQVGLKVFYDDFNQAQLLGKNLYTHLQQVYSSKSKYCAIFVSRHYLDKNWTNHELQSAQSRALRQRSEYILPIRLDDSSLPGIPDTVAYMDAAEMRPTEIAELLITKFGISPRDQVSDRGSSERLIVARHNLYFICGVSSSGKDSLLADAEKLYWENRRVAYLTKYTTRESRPAESSEAQDPGRPSPYSVETVDAIEMDDSNRFVGQFAKYDNLYAFSREELLSLLNAREGRAIVGIYSAMDRLGVLKADIDAVVGSVTDSNITLSIDTHWILVDSPIGDCRSRNRRRNLDRNTLDRKHVEIGRDALLVDDLKTSKFFELVIDNSNSRAFRESLIELDSFVSGTMGWD